MAGDWIKIEHALPMKPEVDQMAVTLGIDHDAVVGKLVRFWIWANEQSESGDALSVTEMFIDKIVDLKGFAKAMQECGWLVVKKRGFCVPHFDRHNGKSAKTRALTKVRMQRSRDGASVTESSPEKRREEKRINTNTSASRVVFERPTVDQVAEYCRERANGIDAQSFVDFYTSKGWKVGNTGMKDWKAAVRTWERNRQQSKPSSRVLSDDELENWNPHAQIN